MWRNSIAPRALRWTLHSTKGRIVRDWHGHQWKWRGGRERPGYFHINHKKNLQITYESRLHAHDTLPPETILRVNADLRLNLLHSACADIRHARLVAAAVARRFRRSSHRLKEDMHTGDSCMFAICRTNVIQLLLMDALSWCHLFACIKASPVAAFSPLR